MIAPALQPSTTVLVIFADDDARRSVCRSLRGVGYSVLEAATAGEGVALATMYRPRAIVLERMLPSIDGLALCGVLRADPELTGTGILILSPFDRPADAKDAFDAGADLYVVSPFTLPELVARVEDLVTNGPRSEGSGMRTSRGRSE